MPLRLVNRNRTKEVMISDTKFQIISMTVSEKEALLHNIATAKTWADPANAGKSFSALLDLIAPVIQSIEGYDDVRKTLGDIEDTSQLKEIINALIEHCGLTDTESKNSVSSLVQPIPVSAGSVEQPANPEDAPVSIISEERIQS